MKKFTINDVYMKRPASVFSHRWMDSTPIGTGKTGAMFYGGASAEYIIINRNDLWLNGKDATVPDVSYTLNKMRDLAKQNRFDEAHKIMFDALNENNYNTSLGDMRTLGCVKIKLECDGIYNNYTRTLHTDTAEAEVSYKVDNKSFLRKYTASRVRDIIAVEIESEYKSFFNLNTGFFDRYHGDREQAVKESDLKYAQYDVVGDCYIYSSLNECEYFGIGVKVVSDGNLTVTADGIKLDNAKKSLLLIKAFSREKDRANAVNAVACELNGCNLTYGEIYNENVKEYQKLYNKADVSLYKGSEFHSNEELLSMARQTKLGAELTEKMWRFGRYLFISGTIESGTPFALYGLWVGGYDCWFTHNVANENVESIYWHTQKGGLAELDKALVNYYFSKMDKFRANAKNLYGTNGIMVGTYSTPVNGAIAWFVPVILHFNGVAGWLSQHFYNYYKHTGDEEMFNNKILPFMLETAQFYEEFCYTDDNGELVLYPAVSPENSPMEYYNKTVPHCMVVTKNPTIEVAILKELLTNLINVSQTRHELKQKADIWQGMLNKLPSYRINKDGAIAEWIYDAHSDAYDHRHISHLYPVFPGCEVNMWDNSELMPYFKKALDLREKGSFSGWSLPHMASIYTRFCDSENVFYCMNALSKICLLENFFTIHHDFRDMGITGNDCGNEVQTCVQFDALMGFVNVVQEMILYTTPNIVKLLPALPVEYNSGSANLNFYDGEISIEWDIENKLCHGTIRADRDTSFKLILPFDSGEFDISLKKGEVYTY